MDESFINRSINVGFSGGEKKRAEMLQLAVLQPKLVILDEIDSGLDIDALKIVCESLHKIKKENPSMAVILITHYQRILKSANQGFQDYAILLIHLPKKHLESVDFVIGLRSIQNHLRKAKATDQIPEAILDATSENLKACLQIIRKQHSQRLERIAEKDFEKVIEWLHMAQKYPKPQGAPT